MTTLYMEGFAESSKIAARMKIASSSVLSLQGGGVRGLVGGSGGVGRCVQWVSTCVCMVTDNTFLFPMGLNS